jgi:uncharacterized protein
MGDNGVSEREGESMSNNTHTVKALYEAFARGDVPYVLGVLDPQCVWNEAENFIYAAGNPYVGPDEVLNGVFAPIGAQWDGFSVNPEQFVSEGATVIALGRYAGTFKSTGKKVSAQFAHVFTFDKGKVVEFQQYTDTAQFRDAVKA